MGASCLTNALPLSLARESTAMHLIRPALRKKRDGTTSACSIITLDTHAPARGAIAVVSVLPGDASDRCSVVKTAMHGGVWWWCLLNHQAASVL